MNSTKGLRVALVGLGFGAEFVRSIVESRAPWIDAATAATGQRPVLVPTNQLKWGV